MRDLDRRTVEEDKIKGVELMERAGSGVADVVRRLSEICGFMSPAVHLVAGRGNNGGDAFVAARQLKQLGYHVEVWLACHANQITGDAFVHYGKMTKAGIKPFELPLIEDWQAAINVPFAADILVDGVLGTGLSGPVRGPSAGAIQYINSQSDDEMVVSIDVPSGLDADTGTAAGDAVRADVTATIGVPKLGLIEQAAADFVGSLDVVDIGIQRGFLDDVDFETDDELIHRDDLKSLFHRRNRNSHKGDYGHALLIGGSDGYGGSISLAAMAAVRSGVGLVSVVVPRGIRDLVAGSALEAMVFGVDETPEGALGVSAWEKVLPRIDDFTAVMIGPGLGHAAPQRELVRRVLAESKAPVIVDADALNCLEGQTDLLANARAPVIITPHPGEMARLLGSTAAKIQSDRRTSAHEAVKRTKATVVLKGAGTIVTAPKHPAHVNMMGNPGMATGGTGDVLSGVVGGLLAQGFKPFDAARAAVYVHGRAGDIAAHRRCQTSLTAVDIIAELPFSFRELSLR